MTTPDPAAQPVSAPTQPRLPAIETLNRLPPAAFADALRPLFEAAGPLASALLAARPFATYGQLIEQAERLAGHLPAAQQVELLNAHPRIGERPAVVRARSQLSFREQGYDTEDPAQVQHIYAELERLNAAYEQRFGFRFVAFVNRRPKSAMLEVLRARLANPAEQELQTGLGELFAIARDRLRLLEAPAD
jgi:2-oxo-4-hydroxy-4-carboxy-5-ureidoimidazoline decarboxylase